MYGGTFYQSSLDMYNQEWTKFHSKMSIWVKVDVMFHEILEYILCMVSEVTHKAYKWRYEVVSPVPPVKTTACGHYKSRQLRQLCLERAYWKCPRIN